MQRLGLAAAAAALAIAPAALAANPSKGATYVGQETKTTLVIAKNGKSIATLKLAVKSLPAKCRTVNPVLKNVPVKGGKFSYTTKVGKISVTVKGEFQTDYLAQITVSMTGGGCLGAYGDALAKK